MKTSAHNLKYITKNKLNLLDNVYETMLLQTKAYYKMLQQNKLPNKALVSSLELPDLYIKHSAWKQIAYRNAYNIYKSNKNANIQSIKLTLDKRIFECIIHDKNLLNEIQNNIEEDYLEDEEILLSDKKVTSKEDIFKKYDEKYESNIKKIDIKYFIRIVDITKTNNSYKKIHLPVNETKQSTKLLKNYTRDYSKISLVKNDKSKQLYIIFYYNPIKRITDEPSVKTALSLDKFGNINQATYYGDIIDAKVLKVNNSKTYDIYKKALKTLKDCFKESESSKKEYDRLQKAVEISKDILSENSSKKYSELNKRFTSRIYYNKLKMLKSFKHKAEQTKIRDSKKFKKVIYQIRTTLIHLLKDNLKRNSAVYIEDIDFEKYNKYYKEKFKVGREINKYHQLLIKIFNEALAHVKTVKDLEVKAVHTERFSHTCAKCGMVVNVAKTKQFIYSKLPLLLCKECRVQEPKNLEVKLNVSSKYGGLTVPINILHKGIMLPYIQKLETSNDDIWFKKETFEPHYEVTQFV